MPPYVLDAPAIAHLGRASLAALEDCLQQEAALRLRTEAA
jgi:adenosylmethionine-8-amino-7-oxononanoate aminotransferase